VLGENDDGNANECDEGEKTMIGGITIPTTSYSETYQDIKILSVS
jgi:hypothetical protein